MRKLWIFTIILVLGFIVNSCGGDDDTIEQPQFRETFINLTFGENEYSATVKGTLLNLQWTGIADKIEFNINVAYETVNGMSKNRFRNVFSDTPTLIVEFTSEYSYWKVVDGEFRTLYLNINEIENLQSFINFAISAMNSETPTTDVTHTHIWDEQLINPTCTETGTRKRICTICEESLTETIDALGHDRRYIVINTTYPAISSGACKICDKTDTRNTQIGDIGEGGGIIFYISTTGFTMTDDSSVAHYLEAAPNDMSTPLAWSSEEYEWGIFISGIGTAIGTGRNNTALILNTDANAPAALACKDYNHNGKKDWFLPSKDELNELYENRTVVENLEVRWWADPLPYYRSSSYVDGFEGALVWMQYFENGNLNTNTRKVIPFYVRAVRAF